MSFLPITMSYLGFDDSKTIDPRKKIRKVILYAIGLSTILSTFGMLAALAGNTLVRPSSGSLTVPLNLAVSIISIATGLNLLGIVQITFPSFENVARQLKGGINSENSNIESILEPLIFGAGTALIAEPCTSPVLTSLLALVSSSGNVVNGAYFLFAYSVGYVTPVISCGLLSGSISSLSKTGNNSWINLFFACLLIMFGTYKFLDTVLS
jgi:cytochrome c-type biogenesis protein